jgi:hypothetical protein
VQTSASDIFPSEEQNFGGCKFKDDRKVEAVWNTMTDDTENGLLSRENRKILPTMRQMPHFWQRACS